MNAAARIAPSIFVTGPKNHSLKVSVYDDWQRRPVGWTKREAETSLSEKYAISTETVRRYVTEIGRYGYYPRQQRKQGRRVFAWSPEALAYLRSYYLAAMREVGSCTRRNAYARTAEKARALGWRIGSEQSAYVHLREINSALQMYARGGALALDNMFYIARDLSKLDPFQIIVGDQHRFDFWCRDEDGTLFRPECYLWLDMRTRLVYGVAFDRHYNSGTVLRALRLGVEMFGKFGSTYNDNGSSESSEWTDFVIEQLQTYGMKWGGDAANLYRTEGGKYAVIDDEGNCVELAPDRDAWRKTNRRIFARVKNAKTKPIERFFSSLEQILRDMCLPGFVREMGASAPEEEEAKRRLKWQQKNNLILSYEEFVKHAARAIDLYQRRRHGSLRGSPLEELQDGAERQGFKQVFFSPGDVAYLFFDRQFVKVQGDRLRLQNQWYSGPALTQEMVLENRGSLVGLDRRKVEVRFDPDNPGSGAFALDPRDGKPIVLRRVERPEMLDAGAASKAMGLKKENMKAVIGAYRAAVGKVLVLRDDTVSTPYLEAQKATKPLAPAADAAPDSEAEKAAFEAAVSSRIAAEAEIKPKHARVFVSDRDRYVSVLDSLRAGAALSARDADFKAKFEASMTDADALYFANYAAFNN